jgi:hypothetical protein
MVTAESEALLGVCVKRDDPFHLIMDQEVVRNALDKRRKALRLRLPTDWISWDSLAIFALSASHFKYDVGLHFIRSIIFTIELQVEIGD